MAFTKAPTVDTYQTKTVPLLASYSARTIDGLKDALVKNVVVDVIEGEQEGLFHMTKREGIETLVLSAVSSGPAVGTIYGVYYQVLTKVLWIAHSAGLARYTSSTVGDGVSGAPAFSDTHIGFEEFSFEDGTTTLIVTDGVNIGSVFTTGPWTSLSDPDLPNPHLPYPVFLDGYLFLARAGSFGTIYNSDNNSTSSWSASGFIAAESYPDKLLAITRQGQYIVALGEETIQWFYDAANPTGTPLAAQTTVVRVGYLGGLAKFGDRVFFLGRYTGGSPQVFELEGLKAVPIGSTPVSRRIGQFNYNYLTTYPFVGHILAINGHNLYTWYQYTPGTTQPYNTVYALDLDTKLWVELEYQGTGGFPIWSSTLSSFGNPTVTKTTTLFSMVGGTTLLQFSPTIYQDVSTNFTASFRTAPYSYGTMRMKFGAKLMINGDQTTGDMSVRWSDDDYQTWSTARDVNLAQTYPQMHALGAFRKRAFECSYSDNYPMRVTSLEIDYNQGGA